MVVDHAMNFDHISLEGAHHINHYSSATFSLLHHTAIFGSQVRPDALGLKDA